MDALMIAATPAFCAGGMLLAWYTLATPYLIGRSLLRCLLQPRPLNRRMVRSQVRLTRDRPQIKPRPLTLAPPGRNGHRNRSLRRVR